MLLPAVRLANRSGSLLCRNRVGHAQQQAFTGKSDIGVQDQEAARDKRHDPIYERSRIAVWRLG